MAEQSRLQAPLVVLPFQDGPRTVVVLAGEADGATAPRLCAQVVGSLGFGTRTLVLDLTDLVVREPQGIDALSGAVSTVEARGVAVSLRGVSPHVAQLLRTSVLRR